MNFLIHGVYKSVHGMQYAGIEQDSINGNEVNV